jgi:hypothetical protein
MTASPSAAIGKSPRRPAAWAIREARLKFAPPHSFSHHVNIIDMTIHLPRRFPRRLLGLVAVAVVAVAGCSDKGVKKVTVRGTISYKGQPLQSGILKFVGPAGSYSAAVIQPDGTFIITDVVPGEVKVGVMEAPQGSGSSSGERASSGPKSSPVALPEKYREPETSGVKYTITPETKELAIEIK